MVKFRNSSFIFINRRKIIEFRSDLFDFLKLWKDSDRDDVTEALPALLQAVNDFGGKEFVEQDLNHVTQPLTKG
jgi:hypothetical protein